MGSEGEIEGDKLREGQGGGVSNAEAQDMVEMVVGYTLVARPGIWMTLQDSTRLCLGAGRDANIPWYDVRDVWCMISYHSMKYASCCRVLPPGRWSMENHACPF